MWGKYTQTDVFNDARYLSIKYGKENRMRQMDRKKFPGIIIYSEGKSKPQETNDWRGPVISL